MKLVDYKFWEFTQKIWNSQKMLTLKPSPKIVMVSLVLMWLLFVLSQLYNASDKKWISSILNHKKLILKFSKQWLSLKNISSLPWVLSILLLWEKPTYKFQMLNGKILVGWKKQKNNFKKWFCSQLNIQKNSLNSVCNHQRVFFSMDHQVVVKLF